MMIRKVCLVLLIGIFLIPTSVADEPKMKAVFELNDSGYIKYLQDNGAVIEAVHKNLVQVSVPSAQLKSMSGLPFVNHVRSPQRPYRDVISQGVGVINASLFHNMGFRGQGVKIAIIDQGFAGYLGKLGTELPANVTARSFRADGDITGGGVRHGTAVAEIIFDIAPDAQFYLINFDTDIEFADAVDFAISQHVDIVSMSLSFLAGPFNGTGFIDDIVNSATSSGIIWVNSAGNYAQKHWEGVFNDPDNNGIHNFSANDETLTMDLTTGVTPSGSDVDMILSWDDWPASNQEYNLCFYNNTGVQLDCSLNVQNGTQEPVEVLSEINLIPDIYHFKIIKFNATRNVSFELYSPNRDLSEYRVLNSSLGIPADAQGVITVGATFWQNDVLESFSSRGPTKDGRTKPDVVAPDAVFTSILGLSPFSGTSASAPHVAGAAALILQAVKNGTTLSPDQMKNILENTSVKLSLTGRDNASGAGRIDMTKVIESLGIIAPFVAANPNIIKAGNATNVTINVTNASIPLSGAIVTLSGAVNGSNITDAGGSVLFRVNTTGAGVITVTATKEGFLTYGTTAITAFVRGDPNGNNVLDIGDMLFTAQAVAGLRTFTPAQVAAADVNRFPGVDVGDVLFIAQALVGLRTL